MKRIITLFMSLFFVVPYISFAETPITVYIDSQKQYYDQHPVIQDGTTLVPLRGIFESLGADVNWNENTQTVKATKECINIELTVGSKTPKINNNVKSISVPAQLINGNTFVPLRFISETFGAKIGWNNETRTIYILSEKHLCETEEERINRIKHDKEVTAEKMKLRVLELVNEERKKEGLSELLYDEELAVVAQEKSDDLVKNNYWSHYSPTYGSPFEMMEQFGIKYQTAGENLGAGYRSPEIAVERWMNSPGHRANILNSSFTHLGVGHAYSYLTVRKKLCK